MGREILQTIPHSANYRELGDALGTSIIIHGQNNLAEIIKQSTIEGRYYLKIIFNEAGEYWMVVSKNVDFSLDLTNEDLPVINEVKRINHEKMIDALNDYSLAVPPAVNLEGCFGMNLMYNSRLKKGSFVASTSSDRLRQISGTDESLKNFLVSQGFEVGEINPESGNLPFTIPHPQSIEICNSSLF